MLLSKPSGRYLQIFATMPLLENLNFEAAISKVTIIEKHGKSKKSIKNANFSPSKSFFKLKIRLN